MTRNMLAALLLAGAAPLAAQQVKPLDPTNMDTTCSACEDFFSYANGGWIKNNAIPADKSSWGSFDELQEANYAALRSPAWPLMNRSISSARRSASDSPRAISRLA